MKHKHYDCIVAWANGETIQIFGDSSERWLDIPHNDPSWGVKFQYRVKPKEDVIRYAKAISYNPNECYISNGYVDRDILHNFMVIFDGETGEFKDVKKI